MNMILEIGLSGRYLKNGLIGNNLRNGLSENNLKNGLSENNFENGLSKNNFVLMAAQPLSGGRKLKRSDSTSTLR